MDRTYEAVLTNGDNPVSEPVRFTAKSVRMAKAKASKLLNADKGTWQNWIETNQWKKVVILPERRDTGKRSSGGLRIVAQVEGNSVLLTEVA